MAKWLSRKVVLIYTSREVDEHILLYHRLTGNKHGSKDHLHSSIHWEDGQEELLVTGAEVFSIGSEK